jgi:hypothetical protein
VQSFWPLFIIDNYDIDALPKISEKSRLLKFCYVPATSAWSSEGIFAAATNSTNQANQASSIYQ